MSRFDNDKYLPYEKLDENLKVVAKKLVNFMF